MQIMSLESREQTDNTLKTRNEDFEVVPKLCVKKNKIKKQKQKQLGDIFVALK